MRLATRIIIQEELHELRANGRMFYIRFTYLLHLGLGPEPSVPAQDEYRYRKIVFPDQPRTSPIYVKVLAGSGYPVLAIEEFSDKPRPDRQYQEIQAWMSVDYPSKSTLSALTNKTIEVARKAFWKIQDWLKNEWAKMPKDKKTELYRSYVEALKSCSDLSTPAASTAKTELGEVRSKISGGADLIDGPPPLAGPTTAYRSSAKGHAGPRSTRCSLGAPD
jgi:hypothetical protein